MASLDSVPSGSSFDALVIEFIREMIEAPLQLSFRSNYDRIRKRCDAAILILANNYKYSDVVDKTVIGQNPRYSYFLRLYKEIDDEFKNSIYFWILICSNYHDDACLHEKCIEVVSQTTDTNGLIKWLVLYGSSLAKEPYAAFLDSCLKIDSDESEDLDKYNILTKFGTKYIDICLHPLEYALFSKQLSGDDMDCNFLFNVIPPNKKTLLMYIITAWRNSRYVFKPRITYFGFSHVDEDEDNSYLLGEIPLEIKENEQFKQALKIGKDDGMFLIDLLITDYNT